MKSAAKREMRVRRAEAIAGIFAIRSPSRTWIGCSRNLETSRRSQWFQLRNGVHCNSSLQHAWNLYGEESFAFEVLEELREQVTGELEKELRQRREQWVSSERALEL
jgi:hypothetical protein